MNSDFDLSEVTDKANRLELELRQADKLNGKLMRLVGRVLEAWDACDGDINNAFGVVEAMAELEGAFDEARERRHSRIVEDGSQTVE